ncbi:lamin tail domain-containing protein [Candidatus Kaiserbacteria bacterium]|nr:lamin tail domain-containing protein [Candidatus Kaiserbacteria bacterium]
MKYFLLAVCVLFPSITAAQVVISEVAWMGSATSANHEWIELQNTSNTAVDVTDWELSDGVNLNITLSGSIAAGAYAVLERTSDDSALGVAWQLYTGALVNTGSTLTLFDSSGAIVDRVVGGENWESIGGDNLTKDTAQRTAGGWITAPATPGTRNATIASSNDGNHSTNNTTATKGGSLLQPSKKKVETPPLTIPNNELNLAVIAAAEGYVHQPLTFTVSPSGLGSTWLNSLTYEWNFGDGHTAKGKAATHQFSYPGTYVVTVFGAFNRYEAVGRFEVTILPVVVSLAKGEKGELLLHNDAPYEIDISDYSVVDGVRTFTFPAYSYIAARQSIVVPALSAEYAFITDGAGMQLAMLSPHAESERPVTVALSAIASPPTAVVRRVVPATTLAATSVSSSNADDVRFGFLTKVPTTTTIATSTATTTVDSVATTTAMATTSMEWAAEASLPPPTLTVSTASATRWHDWWLGALIVLLAISIFAVYTRPPNP